MLDLQILQQQTFDIKMLDGRLLKLKKLSKAQTFVFSAIEGELSREKDIKRQYDLVTERTLFLLNNNLENIKVSKEEVDDLSLDMLLAIAKSYEEFMTNAAQSPN